MFDLLFQTIGIQQEIINLPAESLCCIVTTPTFHCFHSSLLLRAAFMCNDITLYIKTNVNLYYAFLLHEAFLLPILFVHPFIMYKSKMYIHFLSIFLLLLSVRQPYLDSQILKSLYQGSELHH